MAITSNHYSPYTGLQVDKAVSAVESLDISLLQTIANSGGHTFVSGVQLANYTDISSGGYVTSEVVSQIASSVASGTISGAIISGDPIHTVVSGAVVSGALVLDAGVAGIHMLPQSGAEVHIQATPQSAEMSYGDTVLAVASAATLNGEELATKPYVNSISPEIASTVASSVMSGALVDYPTSSAVNAAINGALTDYTTSAGAQQIATLVADAAIDSALVEYPNSAGVSSIASTLTSTALLNYPNLAGVSGIVDAKMGNYPTSMGAAEIASAVTGSALAGYPTSTAVVGMIDNSLSAYPTSSGAHMIATDVVADALVGYTTSAAAEMIAQDTATELIASGNYVGSSYVTSAISSATADLTHFASTLPPAGEAHLNQVYLYIGSNTETYSKGHFYQCQLQEDVYQWVDAQVGTYPPADCSNIRSITQGSVVRLKWRDPEDTIIEGVPIVKWLKTVVVRKQGAYPTSPEDGTVIVTNTVRNQYATTAYTDSLPDPDKVWYYQLFPYSVEGVINTNDTNRTVTDDLSWESIQDIVRSGEARQYFVPGDAFTVPVYNIGMTAQADQDMRIVGIDKMVAAPVPFTRATTFDTSIAYAWSDENGDLIFINTLTPVADDTAWLDEALSVPTATVTAYADGVLMARRLHTLTLEFVKVLDSIQQDAGELEYALTEDTEYHPEYKLNIKLRNASATTVFLLTNRSQTGTDRVWWALNGTYKLWYPEDRGRWEIWQTASGTHLTTQSTAYDYQTVSTTTPTGGTWNQNTAITHGNTYYKQLSGAYTALVEGTDYQQGAIIPADTVYERRPDNNRVYGYNRWRETGIRQYLNASGSNWWVKQNIWDVAPSYVGYRGFLDRLPTDLTRVIGVTTLQTAINAADSGGGSESTQDRFFYLAANDVGLGLINGLAEGATLDYYVSATNAERIKLNASGSASYWWVRSPNVGNAGNVYSVNTSGALSNSYAINGTGCSPACNLI